MQNGHGHGSIDRNSVGEGQQEDVGKSRNEFVYYLKRMEFYKRTIYY